LPHVTIECARDVAGTYDMQALCEDVFQALAAHQAIPDATSLKVRVLPCTHWRIGTHPQSFAHADLRLLPGRSQATKDDLARVVLAQMEKAMPQVGSLSVDVCDLSPSYTKRVL